MTSPAAQSKPAPTRVLVLDEGKTHDVFDVLGPIDSASVVRVRSPFLFEIGEELTVRIEQDGVTSDATARVRAHLGTGADKVTELEIAERSDSRGGGSGG